MSSDAWCVNRGGSLAVGFWVVQSQFSFGTGFVAEERKGSRNARMGADWKR